MAKRKKLPFFAISAVTGEGIDALRYALGDYVRTYRADEAKTLFADAEDF